METTIMGYIGIVGYIRFICKTIAKTQKRITNWPNHNLGNPNGNDNLTCTCRAAREHTQLIPFADAASS